jgi:hypothetical protein
MAMAMRTLIIGGTNFIRPNCVRRLVGVGHEVAVFHRSRTHAELPESARRIVGDRHHLADHREAFHHFGPEIVVDLIAYTEDDARGLVKTSRGLDRRAVVISGRDVYFSLRAYRPDGTRADPTDSADRGVSAPFGALP